MSVTAQVQESVGVITLAEPGRRNPLSLHTMRQITGMLRDFGEDARVRVVVIAADGPAFSAGHDLSELTGRTLSQEREIFEACTELMTAVHRTRQPVIAQVQGMALAAGCQLVATCDLAIAADTARFSTPGVKIGLFCSTPMVALSRNVARKHAMEMLLTGEMIDAEHAARIGLVNKVVAQGRALEAARDWGDLVASKSAMTLKVGKRAFYEQAEMTLEAAYAHASAVMVENMLARDAEEGIGAFVEKRDPSWEHR